MLGTMLHMRQACRYGQESTHCLGLLLAHSRLLASRLSKALMQEQAGMHGRLWTMPPTKPRHQVSQTRCRSPSQEPGIPIPRPSCQVRPVKLTGLPQLEIAAPQSVNLPDACRVHERSGLHTRLVQEGQQQRPQLAACIHLG